MHRLLLLLALAHLPSPQALAQSAATADSTSEGGASEVVFAVSPSNRDNQWRPTAAQTNAVLARARSYFELRDGGKLDEAYSMFSPSQRAVVPMAAWRSGIESFNATAGAPGGRTLRKITWYRDPPQRQGTFAAVDFYAQFANLALHCGYSIWHEQPDGSFALAREEDNVIDRQMEAKLKPGQLEQIRAQFRC